MSVRPWRTASWCLARPSVLMTTGDFMQQGRVPRGAHADCLRKHGGDAAVGDAVEGFAPPVVGGDVQARNGAGLVDQLRGLFFQRHAGDEVVDALFHWQGGIHVGGVFVLSVSSGSH